MGNQWDMQTCDSKLMGEKFNRGLYNAKDRMEKWLDLIDEEFKKYTYLVNRKSIKFKDLKVDVKELLRNYSRHSLKR